MSFPKPSAPLATISSICRQCRTRITQQHHTPTTTTRTLATQSLTNSAGLASNDNAAAPPRWARTPQAMRAPHRVRPKNDNDDYDVNEDPKLLNSAYVKMLGADGDKMLPDEIKWLAVTHKSFDHGRRGFNDRLAFLGKRIVDLQTSLALLNGPTGSGSASTAVEEDIYGRIPFQHPSLANLESVTSRSKEQLLDKRRLAQLAERYGLNKVIRWKPRQISRLESSGVDVVLTQTLYAIVGAVSLQQGGEVATQTARQRILAPLGII